MATFEVNGKEHELKITYEAVKRLNKAFEGGTFEVIGKALSGDFEAFPIIVHAALLHTGENISLKDVETAIEQAIENESISQEDILRISNEVATESFFFKPTVEKMMKQNPEMRKAYEQVLGR